MKTPDIEQIKTELSNMINSWLDEAKGYLFQIYDEIDSAKTQLSSLTTQYTSISKTIEKAKADLATMEGNLQQEAQAFYNERDEFNAKKDYAKSEYQNNLRLIELSTDTRNNLLKQIESLKSKLAEMNNLTQIKDTLLQEVEDLNEQSQVQRDNIRQAELESQENLRKNMVLCEAIKKEITSLNADIATAKSIVLPQLNEVEDREKAVAAKERDLQTIIERYKKLYADQGAGFMI